ncbi:MAG: hypothetical protein WC815_09515 [Vicinamibacterales bacterium]|jgi:hypothetical protein
MVTVLPPMTDTDHEDWASLSAANLARAYGDDEPDYTETSVRDRLCQHLSGGQRQDQPRAAAAAVNGIARRALIQRTRFGTKNLL